MTASIRFRPLFTIVVLAMVPGGVLGATMPDGLATFLESRCLECHDSEMQKGGLDLEALPFDLADAEVFRRWVKVHDKVRDHRMPPAKAEQPTAGERSALLAALEPALVEAERRKRVSNGRTVIRRLNRVEFETALSDLFEVPMHVSELLPPDAQGDGFDTVGEALNVSSVQMQAYLDAIDVALDRATHLIPQPERRKYRLSYLQTNGMMQEYRRTGPFHPLEDGVAMFAPDYFSHFNSLLDTWVVAHSARYKVKVSAYALRSGDPVTLTVRMGGPGHNEVDSVRKKLLGNVSVSEGEAQVFEFDEFLERGQMLRIYPSSLRPMRFEGRSRFGKQGEYRGPAVVVQWVEVDGPIYDEWPPAPHRRLYAGIPTEPIPGARRNRDPNAHLDEPPTGIAKPRMKQLSKPDKETGNRMVYDPALGIGGEKIYRRTRIVNEELRPMLKLAPRDPVEDARRLIRRFVGAAYRRPATAADVAPLMALAERWLGEGVDFEQVMRTVYKAVLTSPGFLYHGAGRAGGGRLDPHELAERLAFTLWCGPPDSGLRAAARSGELDPRAHVDRLLADPRAGRFIDHFLGQWLDLRLIDFTSPDSDLYPEFDPLLQWSMVEETKAFFRELLQHDLPVTNIIDSDFAMLNARLAKHYGIDGVLGAEIRRVALPPDSVRGGVLTQGSVLKVTANGTTTSPVVRGVWLLEKIMGAPPDPPPPGVPAIEPDIRGAITVREQLEKHREVASCASCHRQIDPPGVALESFDVIGGYRDSYRAIDPGRTMARVPLVPDAPPPPRWVKGLDVDPADELEGGRAFRDVREFQRHLLDDPAAIAHTVAEKLVVYATGAPVGFADREEVERIVAASAERGYGFRTLLTEVIASPLFETR